QIDVRPPVDFVPVKIAEAGGPLLKLEAVGAESGEDIVHLVPKPLKKGHHRNDGGNTNDDAEQRQHASQAVPPKRAERELEVVGKHGQARAERVPPPYARE